MTVALPLLIPLLFSQEFGPVIGMMRGSILAMYLRALSLPIEYIALSRGNSRAYLVQEGFAAVLLVVSVVTGFHFGGLTATGYSITIATLLELIFVLFLTYYKYGYRLSRRAFRLMLLQTGLGLATLLAVLGLDGPAYWLVGAALVGVSGTLSWRLCRPT